MTTIVEKQFLSPPEVAEMLGVGHCKVLNWILRGDLRAADLCMVRGQRPRYKIARDDLESFLARRCTTPEPRAKRRRRRQPDDGVIPFYEE